MTRLLRFLGDLRTAYRRVRLYRAIGFQDVCVDLDLEITELAASIRRALDEGAEDAWKKRLEPTSVDIYLSPFGGFRLVWHYDHKVDEGKIG